MVVPITFPSLPYILQSSVQSGIRMAIPDSRVDWDKFAVTENRHASEFVTKWNVGV